MKKERFYVGVIALMVIGLGIISEPGCGYGKPACTVIDAAHEACTVIRYLDKDGTVREVSITPSELQTLGLAAAARASSANSPAPVEDAGSR